LNRRWLRNRSGRERRKRKCVSLRCKENNLKKRRKSHQEIIDKGRSRRLREMSQRRKAKKTSMMMKRMGRTLVFSMMLPSTTSRVLSHRHLLNLRKRTPMMLLYQN